MPRFPLPASRFPLRIVLGALVIIAGASCKAAPTPQCLQFAADLMPAFAGGLIQKNLRVANAWAVKSDQMVDSAGVSSPRTSCRRTSSRQRRSGSWNMAYNGNHEARTVYSVSPQAQKYTSWAKAGDVSTAGVTMQSVGAKESVACVLNNRPGGAQTTTTTKTTTP